MKSSAHTFRVGDAFEISSTITEHFPLVICDAPYGRILKKSWDVAQYQRWMALCAERSAADATICMWGGIGKRGHRPFLQFAATVEDEFPEWTIANWITWRKKRAYGVQRNYLFTREECLILTRGVPTFNIPLLSEERGYAGYKSNVEIGRITARYHALEGTCPCVSPGAQAQGERDVHQLLRQMVISPEEKAAGGDRAGVARAESGALEEVQQGQTRGEPGDRRAGKASVRCKKTRDTIQLDRRRSANGLDGYLPRLWDTHGDQHKEAEQLDIDRQSEQLCWVCTRQHLRDVLARKQAKGRCLTGGIGEACHIHARSSSSEDLAVMARRLRYSAKSKFLRRTNVWTDITEILRGKTHSAQKPEALYQILIETHSKPGDCVFDPCAGSGTTARAAQACGRRSYLIELKGGRNDG